ncbi:MAG: hypothetical protein AAF909_05005 [Pseudomonadota bacterium]
MTDSKHDQMGDATATASAAPGQRISLSAVIEAGSNRALDPQQHDANAARDIALELCSALSESYGRHAEARPETLAVAVQTVLETLISSIEREGVDAASMRVALANSLLVNGDAEVSIDVDGKPVPSIIADVSRAIH